MDGSFAYPTRRTTSSTRSAGSVRSGRHEGGATVNSPPSTVTEHPMASSVAITSSTGMSIPATCEGRSPEMRMTRSSMGASTAVIP